MSWTPAQVKAFRITVNRSATWAEWDEELLAQELRELEIADFDLALTGFDAKELDELRMADTQPEDEVPPLPHDPVTRPGDLWLCGSHRVLIRGVDIEDIEVRVADLELASQIANSSGRLPGRRADE